MNIREMNEWDNERFSFRPPTGATYYELKRYQGDNFRLEKGFRPQQGATYYEFFITKIGIKCL